MIPRLFQSYWFCFFLCSTSLCTESLAQSDSTLWQVRAGDVIPPVSLGIASLVVQGKVSRQLQEHVAARYPTFHSRVDDYLPYVPGVVSLGLASAGVKGRHRLGDQVILALVSNIIAQGVTQGLKKRPATPGQTEKNMTLFLPGIRPRLLPMRLFYTKSTGNGAFYTASAGMVPPPQQAHYAS